MSETKNSEYIVEAAKDSFFEEVNGETQQPVSMPSADPRYTEEDLKKVREQEKSKLYPQIESLKDELSSLKKAEQERAAELERQRAEAEAEAKRKAEAEMDVRELLQQKEQEWQTQLELERQEREKAFALLERERTFAELNEYRSRRIEEERDNIMPELIDLIAGNNTQEIEESIANLKSRSNRIVEAVQAATQSERRQMTGSRVTAPPSGPLDTNTDQSPVTAEQIAAMSVSEYAKYRNKLLGQAASERGKGLFG